MNLIIHIDGGSRGNPGPAAAGVVIADEATDKSVVEAGYHLGRATNNVAEYMGLIRSLEVVEQLKTDGGCGEIEQVIIISDSQLMVRQINGQYKVKNETLKGLFTEAKRRLARIGSWRIGHVKRELNKRADELANQAMDAGRDVIVVGPGASATRSKASPASPSTEPSSGKSKATPAVTESPKGTMFSAYLTKSPGKKCLARCPAKTPFHFGPQIPQGFCVYAAQAVFDENPTLWREAGTEQSQTQCPKCNVTIEVERNDA